MGGELPVRIDAGVDLLEDQGTGQPPACGGKLLRSKILQEREGKDSAVAVVGQDRLIADLDVTAEESLGKGDLLMGEGEDLGVIPIQR